MKPRIQKMGGLLSPSKGTSLGCPMPSESEAHTSRKWRSTYSQVPKCPLLASTGHRERAWNERHAWSVWAERIHPWVIIYPREYFFEWRHANPPPTATPIVPSVLPPVAIAAVNAKKKRRSSFQKAGRGGQTEGRAGNRAVSKSGEVGYQIKTIK